MQRIKIMVVGFVFLVALLAFACTYTVRFTETAVLTKFGQAGEDAVKREPGLYFRPPYPFASVTTYDTRVRTQTVKFETQQTADSKQVVVETFCLWRVEDPLKFFRSFSNAGDRPEDHYRKAETALDSAMRSAVGLISKYSMDDLFTTGPAGSKLPELESRMLESLKSASADKSGLTLRDYGIGVEDIGLMRIVLPEETTKAVFQRMQAARDRIAKETEARGDAEAQAIRSKAENDAKRIRDFAERLAMDIRTTGDQESAEYYKQMNAKPELAMFLASMDFLKEAYGKRTTLVLSGSTPGVNLLFPDALAGLKDGELPRVASGHWLRDAMDGRGGAGPKANAPGNAEGRP